jgi:hypothetical protein
LCLFVLSVRWKAWKSARDVSAKTHLQMIVFGEIQAELPGHEFMLTQIVVNDHAFLTIQRVGHTPG